MTNTARLRELDIFSRYQYKPNVTPASEHYHLHPIKGVNSKIREQSVIKDRKKFIQQINKL